MTNSSSVPAPQVSDLDALLKESERIADDISEDDCEPNWKARDCLRRLSAALRAASADAGRYRFLRKGAVPIPGKVAYPFGNTGDGKDVCVPVYETGEKLDAAIDAAMEPKP